MKSKLNRHCVINKGDKGAITVHDIEHETLMATELYKASENDLISLC